MTYVVALLIGCLSSLAIGCKRAPYSPARPVNVSGEAVYIQGPDGHGLWNACGYKLGKDYCSIWTVGGNLLSDGVFVPYDGGDSIEQSDLKIAQQGGSAVILLENGRYLIPSDGSSHEAALRYLDFMTSKTKSFDSKAAGKDQ